MAYNNTAVSHKHNFECLYQVHSLAELTQCVRGQIVAASAQEGGAMIGRRLGAPGMLAVRCVLFLGLGGSYRGIFTLWGLIKLHTVYTFQCMCVLYFK